MAEFQEVMREWVRSRKTINENMLSLWPLEMFSDDYIANIEKEVMAWAAEHPEPPKDAAYPTWSEWLVEIGVFPKMMSTNPSKALKTISNGVCQPIPAEMAQKLGIKPCNNLAVKTSDRIDDEC